MSISIWLKAKALYEDHVGSTGINPDYFREWGQLPDKVKYVWYDKARKHIAFKEDDGA